MWFVSCLCCVESLENDPFFAGAFDDDTPKQAAEDRRAQAKKDRAARKAAKEAERKLREREQAELELLMMDSVRASELVLNFQCSFSCCVCAGYRSVDPRLLQNATSAQGFDKRAIVKAEKAKKSKRGRKRRRKDAEDDFHPDVQDPRFSAVYVVAQVFCCWGCFRVYMEHGMSRLLVMFAPCWTSGSRIRDMRLTPPMHSSRTLG